MKRLSIIIYLMLCAFPIHSQELDFDYNPFIEEGKVWVKMPAGSLHFYEPYNHMYYGRRTDYYYFQGDTIIGHKRCKKWVQEFRDSLDKVIYSYVIPIYEEDKKVWFFLEDFETPFLAYDFGARVGDTIAVLCPNAYYYYYCRYTYHNNPNVYIELYTDTLVIDSITIKDIRGVAMSENTPLIYYHSTFREQASSEWLSNLVHFIPGIGTPYGPEMNWYYVMRQEILMFCVRHNDILYANNTFAQNNGYTCPTPDTHPELFGLETSINPPQIVNSKSSNSKYYDLSGRRLSAPPAKGVYIDNGKKRVAK